VQVARSLGWFDDAELIDLQLAVGEGIANAIEHGFREQGFFEVRCYVADATRFIVEIEDFGKGVDLNEIGVPVGPARPDRGFGVDILYKTVDCLQFARLDTGTLLRLIKRRALSSRGRFRRSSLFENPRTQ
jgi:anti-sigma regulatory factor (Ser/Thr protein kinase)